MPWCKKTFLETATDLDQPGDETSVHAAVVCLFPTGSECSSGMVFWRFLDYLVVGVYLTGTAGPCHACSQKHLMIPCATSYRLKSLA